MRVLVCGGRDYQDAKRLNEELYRIHNQSPITCLIEEGARGADQLAAMWAAVAGGVEHLKFKADWGRYGKAAGPMRNQKMLKEGWHGRYGASRESCRHQGHRGGVIPHLSPDPSP